VSLLGYAIGQWMRSLDPVVGAFAYTGTLALVAAVFAAASILLGNRGPSRHLLRFIFVVGLIWVPVSIVAIVLRLIALSVTNR